MPIDKSKHPMSNLLKPRTEDQIEAIAETAAAELDMEALRKICKDIDFCMDVDQIVGQGSDIHRGSKKYSPEKKLEAALGYILYANWTKVSELANIPKDTLKGWAKDTEWWPDLIHRARGFIRQRNYGQLLEIMDQANEQVLEGLRLGDEKLTRDGEKVRVAVPAKDAAFIGKLASEQVSYMQGNTVRDKNKVADELRDIKESLRELGKLERAKEIPGEAKVVKDEE